MASGLNSYSSEKSGLMRITIFEFPVARLSTLRNDRKI